MKKLLFVILLIALSLTILACGRQVAEVPPIPDDEDVVIDPNPASEMVEVTLYFMNREYIITGNAELEKIIEVKREVAVGEKSIEEMIIAELQKKPEDENLYTALENIKILSVETAGNTTYVNVSSDRLSGGSLEESSILTQVVYSLTELPEVTSVQFLVDGSKRESLMGHFIIEEPLTREN